MRCDESSRHIFYFVGERVRVDRFGAKGVFLPAGCFDDLSHEGVHGKRRLSDSLNACRLLVPDLSRFRIFGEKLGIAKRDCKWGLEVVGKCCNLLAAPLLNLPLGFQRISQRDPHPLHGMQHVVHFGYIAASNELVQILLTDGSRRLHQGCHLAREHAAGAQGDEGYHEDQGEQRA